MAFIFYSETPSYLKVDGKFIGVINKNAKILTDIDNFSFLSFIPISSDSYSVETTLKESFGVKVFNLLDDKIIIPLFDKKRNLPYKLLYQNRFNLRGDFLLVTIIQDGFYKFYLDGIVNHIDELPFKIDSVEIKEIQNRLFIAFFGIKTILFAFDMQSKKLLYKNFLDEFDFTDCFTATTQYNTLLPVKIIEKRDYDFNLINRDFEFIKKPYDVHKKLLSVCFFELISLNANVSFLLSENLKNREKDLHDFIGKPIAVFPYYKDINKTIVLLNGSAHLYNLTFNNGLIENILEE